MKLLFLTLFEILLQKKLFENVKIRPKKIKNEKCYFFSKIEDFQSLKCHNSLIMQAKNINYMLLDSPWFSLQVFICKLVFYVIFKKL